MRGSRICRYESDVVQRGQLGVRTRPGQGWFSWGRFRCKLISELAAAIGGSKRTYQATQEEMVALMVMVRMCDGSEEVKCIGELQYCSSSIRVVDLEQLTDRVAYSSR